MNPVNLDALVSIIKKSVDDHKLSPGCYARYLWNNEKGTRLMGRNEYGCADAANILYTIGAFPTEPQERAEFIRHLQEMQDPESGRQMAVITDAPGLQFYSGNYTNTRGKGGVSYPKRSGICLETQFFPDAVNHPEWKQPFLKAGEKFHSETKYVFHW